MNTPATSLCLILFSVLAACGPSGSSDAGLDASVLDGFSDARSPDAGTQDTGAPDTGTPDVGALDGGTTTIESCFEGLEPRENNFINTLDFESVDGELRVLLARERGMGTPAGETYPYQLVRFAIQRGDVVECITSSDSLMWDYAHHNWDETVTAEGEATYVVRLQYSFMSEPATWIDTLSIDGGEALPLRLRACETLPATDLNHCLSRGER